MAKALRVKEEKTYLFEDGSIGCQDTCNIASNHDSNALSGRLNNSAPRIVQFCPTPEVYTLRWYILATVTLLNLSNAMSYFTFAMIADSTALYYNITLTEVNWLSIIVLLAFVIIGPVSIWFLDKFGLKAGTMVNGWATLIGGGIRVLSAYVPLAGRLPTLITGQVLIALSQPIILAITTKMAALWFPEDERILANAITSLGVTLGMMASSVISPAIAGQNYQALPKVLIVDMIPITIATLMATVGIRHSQPPKAPSFVMIVEDTQEKSFEKSVKNLISETSYVILAIVAAIHFAILATIGVLIEQILCPVGYPDDFSGLCIVIMTMCGFIAAVITTFFVKEIYRFESTSKILLAITNLGLIGFILSARQRNNQVLLCLFSAIYGVFGMSLLPILLELGVECTYPIDETISSGILFILATIISIVLIIVLPLVSPPLNSSQMQYSVCHHHTLVSKVTSAPTSTPASNIIPRDYSWSGITMLVMLTLATIVYIVFFHTDYKRKREEDSRRDNYHYVYRLEGVSSGSESEGEID